MRSPESQRPWQRRVQSMVEEVARETSRHGDRSRVIPIDSLSTIRADVEELRKRERLNDFQKYIVGQLYVLDAPPARLGTASIIVVASRSPSLARLHFTWKGKRIPLMLPAGYIDKEAAPARIQRYLADLLEPLGYHLSHEPSLPRKLLAARSGLAVYGRNNLCYVAGLGSFFTLSTFFSDVPCADGRLSEIGRMARCADCTACVTGCPTGAISTERFLIDSELCLTYYNEGGGGRFPDWMDPGSHNCVYGCHRCQTVCPANLERLDDIVEPADFDEEETLMLLAGVPVEQFPRELREKVAGLNMTGYLAALPRNLPVLLERHG